MKRERNSLSKDDQMAFNKAIQEKIFELEDYRNNSILFTYVSFQSEVDTWTVINQALKDKKQVFAPRVNEVGCNCSLLIHEIVSNGDSQLIKEMDFYEIYNTNAFILSKFGILEPMNEEKNRYKGTEEIINGNSITNYQDLQENEHENNQRLKLMLLPGLAFDPYGNRIGYGAGFYDSYLRKHLKDNFFKIALAYDFQILGLINTKDHDVRADMIITPSKIIQCNNSFRNGRYSDIK